MADPRGNDAYSALLLLLVYKCPKLEVHALLLGCTLFVLAVVLVKRLLAPLGLLTILAIDNTLALPVVVSKYLAQSLATVPTMY